MGTGYLSTFISISMSTPGYLSTFISISMSTPTLLPVLIIRQVNFVWAVTMTDLLLSLEAIAGILRHVVEPIVCITVTKTLLLKMPVPW